MRCSKCGKPRDVANQRYCRSCQAEFQRAWRAKRKRQLKALVRASFDHAEQKYGDEGAAAQLALLGLDPQSRQAQRIVYAENPGEAMMAWYREHTYDTA